MRLAIDPFRLLLISLAGWLNQQQQDVIDYLQEENRVLREQLEGKRLRFNDDQRRRLAVPGELLICQQFREFSVSCYHACVKKTSNRHAVREMKGGPSKPPCRRRLQTAISCFGPKAAVVNVMVKRRDFDPVR
jgi:hypothetical protein